ncbi:biotin/lipoyl-binding protein [Wenyingzhuangia sp. 2_MG-2023]|uniref:biotin/lipoyl-binding protein n=1 Tax=Wenyingzhuangia sp. 2_MG-2023 TaxID=3062639 RepID=UPI0026E12B6D|nr:biotin/lipoyl-binding protein [Wenyingzhuangia sp. 2_MG-2023]MDO6736463.1 HlyD family efflux transporter periplasmic adaptor subunit [Wenyingzhuangia sp. 2_MG-2023]
MKKNIFISILGIYIFSACTHNSQTSSTKTQRPKTPVEVVSINHGIINQNLEFFGSTIYLKKNLVTAPIPSFITNVHVLLGDNVKKGDILYTLRSKESKALGDDISLQNNSIKNFGIIQVKASASGIVSTLDKQQSGDYVLEGAQLCSIIENNNLAFQINIPFEYAHLAKLKSICKITLSNHQEFTATFTKKLNSINTTTQTQTFLAKATKTKILPEGLFVKSTLIKEQEEQHQILPKSCVLSDEMLHDFWVMKITNDSTAIKIPVVIGNKNKDSIEILTPQFSDTDKIISVGNYGLPETAFVSINNKK